MLKYIINRCKNYTWVMLLVVLLGALSTMATQYIYKFTGYLIDYGLNYTGVNYEGGALDFLFTGKFGEYGSLKLMITLAICMVLCALLSYILGYLSSLVQMKGQYALANGYRKEIFKKSKGKKFPYSNGDMLVVLQEDVSQPGTIFVSHLSGIISTAYGIVFTFFMLSSISPYLLITPIAISPLLIFYAIKYHKATYKENQLYRNVDGELRETISRITATKLQSEYSTFRDVNGRHTKERKQLSHVSNNYNIILNIIKLSIYIISCTVAGILAIRGDILIGEYLIFTTFINTIYTQILSLINYFITIRSAQPRVEKVRELLEVHLNEAE